MNIVSKLDEKGFRLVIETDTSENFKDKCLHCEIEVLREDKLEWEYITTIRANDFQDLEKKLIAYFG